MSVLWGSLREADLCVERKQGRDLPGMQVEVGPQAHVDLCEYLEQGWGCRRVSYLHHRHMWAIDGTGLETMPSLRKQ